MVAGIEIIRIPYFGSTRYPIAVSVLKHIRDADIVHVHAIDFFFDFLAWTKPLHGKRLVVSTHGGFFHTTFAARLKQLYFSTVTRGSMLWYDGVAAVSLTDQTQFSRIRPRGLVCIENGVNTSKFLDASSRHPTKSMIWIGRFSQNKRLDRLIRLFAALLRKDSEWTLTIAGQPWDLGAQQLRDLASAAGAEKALVVVESPPDTEIRRLIGGCSVIVSSSDYEGFGLAAIEGMSAGLFPLLSDIAPFKRLVSSGGIGLNVNFDDSAAAASSFLDVWQKILAGYASVRERSISAASYYTWENVSRLYQSLYDDALGARCRTILDVPVFVGTEAEAVEQIDAHYDAHETTIVVFANAKLLNVAAVDDRFRTVVRRCMVMNDGIGVDAASRILFGSGFPQNLNGTDFVPNYLKNTKNSYRGMPERLFPCRRQCGYRVQDPGIAGRRCVGGNG
jgi:alpha-1,3-mannosyltransferase